MINPKENVKSKAANPLKMVSVILLLALCLTHVVLEFQWRSYGVDLSGAKGIMTGEEDKEYEKHREEKPLLWFSIEGLIVVDILFIIATIVLLIV